MAKFEYKNEQELIMYAKEAEGKYLYEIDKNKMLANSNVKGSVGHIIESSYFGYDINSNAEADFADVGIELKATGITKMKSGKLKAKERLVLNIINYESEANSTFETSSYWKKNARILLFFYEYKRDENNKMDRNATQIVKVSLFELPEDDLKIVKQDWETIHNKILNGEAHLLSEGDTLILGACTKGSTAEKSLRKQPFSHIPAKQRAYSIKQGYMSNLVRKLISNEHLESITTSKEIAKKSLIEIIEDKVSKFYDKTDTEIASLLNYSILKTSKASSAKLFSKMLGIKGNKLSEIEEFEKYNIQFKTITLNENGSFKEHMSFKNINFQDYLDTDWDYSELKETFETTKWLFAVFQKNEHGEKVFKKVVLWNMPGEDINVHLKSFYETTQNILKNGVILTETKKGIKNNLPGAKDNPVCHIRPKAQNASDKVKLPDGQEITKQCFWLNKEYLRKIIFN